MYVESAQHFGNHGIGYQALLNDARFLRRRPTSPPLWTI
jgi:hypothetical protein